MAVTRRQPRYYAHLLINLLLTQESKCWQSEAKIRFWQNIFSLSINIHFP